MAAVTAKSKKTRQDFAGAINATVDKKAPTSEKKAGRPSSGKTVKITLAIPENLMSGIDSAALLHKGNRTAYINSLIQKDLNENLTKYEEFHKLIMGQ